MFSSAEHFAGAGPGGIDDQLFLHQHHDHDNVGQMYHVPQHSRREKLRFPQEEQLPQSPPTSLLLLHDPNAVASAPPPVPGSVSAFYHANSLAPFLPSSSSSSSAPPCSSNSSTYYYANQSPTYGVLAPVTQYLGHEALASHPQQAQHQISGQGFSLSLSSSFPVPPPRPLLGCRPAPMGPFTGYSAVLSRSRYLDPAQKLLDDACDVGHKSAAAEVAVGDKEMMLLDADPSLEVLALADQGTERRKDNSDPVIPSTEQQWKKTRLISMLDEVYRKYKQYYQQVQAVITSFEAVAGLSSAAPFALMALKAMSRHFISLKNAISDQLRQTNKVLGREGTRGEETSSFGLLNGGGVGGLQRTSSAYHSGAFSQPHVWRPQRGLPERAVSVLRAWLFEHFLHPYPTDTDKQILAKQTGLTRNQVSNWFINARVRLWKPMVEEIHSLEIRQKNKAAPTEHHQSDCSADQQPQIASSSNATRFSGQLPQIPASTRENECCMSKNVQGDLIQMQQQPMDFALHSHLSNPHHFSVGMAGACVANAGKDGVSLTLGLQQDSSGAINFSERLPLNVARRFGLDECSDAYVVSSFGGQERLFAKDATDRLLHDFVG